MKPGTFQKLKFCGSLIVAALVSLSSIGSSAEAQETKSDPANNASVQDLPSGEAVMAKHIKMSGGMEAFDKIKNRISETTLEIVGAGIKLDLTTYAAKPNKMLLKMDSSITGKVEKGCTGDVFWENSLTGGPVVHEGQQKAMGLRESIFERYVYWQQGFESAKCVGVSKVNDLDCYEVVLTPKKMNDADESKPTRLFLDKKDYLIRKVKTVLDTEAGSIPFVAYPGDYKKVDGITMSHKVNIEMLGQKRVATVTKVEHNVDLPANQFDPPEEIQELIK